MLLTVNGVIGKKIGMTSVYNDKGQAVPCTVVEVEPNVVTQIKTDEVDGYYAVQLATGSKKEKNTSQPLLGHFEKAGTTPKRMLREFKTNTLEKALGDDVRIEEVFEVGDKVSAVGITKGKGFQGVVKRHGFRGVGDATHGQHNRMRAPGSIGAASYPSRVFKGMRMAGRTGGKRVKIRGLQIVQLFPEKNLLLVKGAIPGHKGSFVIIEK